MNASVFSIRLEAPADQLAIDRLNEAAFGPGRFARAAYRLRECASHEPGLSFVAELGGRFVGSVRLTRILVGERPALLLGPLVVDDAWKDQGCGRQLVGAAMDAARQDGHELIILVGDAPYYAPLGFQPIEPKGAVTFPGPVDPGRLLVAKLKAGSAAGLSGPARPRHGR